MTDFKTIVKWTHEAMKLMIVKYVLQVILVTRNDVYVSKANVHYHGLYSTLNKALWTPENVWLER